MDYFRALGSTTYCEEVPLSKIAEEVGTPLYVYSKRTLVRHLQALKDAFASYPTLTCYAVKANSNLKILREVFAAGFGADLVSQGELMKSLKAGVKANQVVFSGVGKQREEIKLALQSGILAFNVESSFELDMISEVAKECALTAPLSLRINPNIKAETNPKIATGMYTSKFGIPEEEARELIRNLKGRPELSLVGLACHIGSQMTQLGPLEEAAQRMARFAQELLDQGYPLTHLDLGGGLGIRYQNEAPPSLEAYAQVLIRAVKPTGLTLIIEPGRVIVGNCGIFLSKVIGVKETPEKTFVVVDGAMNDLIRPAMYDSYHEILPVEVAKKSTIQADIVGPVCESSDFFGKNRPLPAMQPGDLLYLRGAGAYGAVMASNYNARPRPAEVLVDGDTYEVVRKRESYEQIWALEE